jgi:hypothetical protein
MSKRILRTAFVNNYRDLSVLAWSDLKDRLKDRKT